MLKESRLLGMLNDFDRPGGYHPERRSGMPNCFPNVRESSKNLQPSSYTS
jgi:hypothetical protein